MVNGALIQIVMASRILYGLARQGALPESLGVVHPRTRTPVRAVGLVILLVAVLALALPIAALAETTALLALVVFATVNAALWRIHRREGDETPLYRAPPWVPIGGLLASAALVALELHRLALGS
jgi:amino acid transporter